MSLPPAQQEISEHPHANTVTAPTDRNAQAADVDKKIRLYGMIQAFRQGRMPDNAQINSALSYLRDAGPVDVQKLSPDGQKLIHDCREIVETARLIVKQKNADELFQSFVWHTRDTDAGTAKAVGEEAPEVDRDKLTEDSRVAVRHLRTFFSLILTNSEVRKLLSDFTVIGRDLLAKGASKAAETLRPSEQEMAQVDQPAESASAGGNPRSESGVEPSQGEATAGPGQAISEGKQAARSVQETATDVRDKAAEKAQETTKKGKKIVEPQDSATGESSAGSSEESEGLLKAAKERLNISISEDTKHWFGENLEKGRQFVMDEYFPPERQDRFIYRGKRVIVECQRQDDYRDAINWFLSIAGEYAEFGQSAEEKGKERVTKLINDPYLRQTFSELRTLLERFANGKSMHVIFDSIGAVNDDAHRDEEFRAWFQHLYAFVRKLLLEEGYVLGDDCSREGRDIRESGRKFWDQKYRGHFEEVFKSIGDWFSAMGEDPLNKQFGEDWARLTRDLLFDSEGSLKFKSELWMDIRSVIVPALVEKLAYLPIPRIEYSDAALDLVLENLTLQGSNLFPNIVTVVNHNYLKFSPYHNISDEYHHDFTFTLGQIQADMRDVAFFFRKKGFPKVVDSGLADVVLGGSGLTAIIHLVSAGKDRTSVFKVKDVHVKVSSLKFSIRDSKHDLLYKTLKPLASNLVKRQIKKAIAGAIKTGLEYVDGQLVSVRDRMEEAKSSDESNMQVLQELFKRHKEEQSVRTSESKSQFKVVSSIRSSVIDTGTPSGWVNRVSESEEAATKGKDWRSQAFTIV